MERALPKPGSLLRAAAIACLLLGPGRVDPVTAADAPTRAEAESVKAAMTSIILRNTQWPESAFTNASASFGLGIIGRNPPTEEFNAAFEGVTISGHPVTIVSLKHPADAEGLQAVYFSEASTDVITQTLALLSGKPAITFGDHDAFLKLGGIVNFRTVSGKLRFEFNRKSMDRSGVKVSAQVIRLALPSRDEEAEK